MEHIQHVRQHCTVIRCILRDPVHFPEQRRAITLDQGIQHAEDIRPVQGTQHPADALGFQAPATERYRLVRQTQGITHAAICGAPQQPEGAVFILDAFLGQDMFQVGYDQFRPQALEIELQAA